MLFRSKDIEQVDIVFIIDFLPLLTLLQIPLGLYLNRAAGRQDDLFADSLAVMITRDPDALSSAISKITASGGNINFHIFRLLPSILGRSSTNVSSYVSISKYFFVNPMHSLSQYLPAQDVPWASYRPPYAPGKDAIIKEGYEAKDFIRSRLMALDSIERGSKGIGQGHREPADQWD